MEADQAATADLFTTDAQVFTMTDREAIREHFAGIAKVDHNVNVALSSNLIVEIEDHATATNYVCIAHPCLTIVHAYREYAGTCF